MDQAFLYLVIILAMAALAPVLVKLISPVFQVPVAVMEMILGIVIGPAVLGLVGRNDVVALFSTLGMVFLFFFAGYDTDIVPLRGKPITTAFISWLVCLVLATFAGFVIANVFPVSETAAPMTSAIFIGAALTSTALGTILPMVRDAGELDTRVGRALMPSGVVGQFAPLLAVAILVGQHSPGRAFIVHVIFFALTAGLLWLSRNGLPKLLARTADGTINSSGQFGTRFTLVICLALVALGLWMGVDRPIAAFAAGLVMRALFRNTAVMSEHQRNVWESKFLALAFGIFLPVFFIYNGVIFDLAGLLAQPSALALIPVLLLLKFFTRGLPGSVTLPRGTSLQERAATSLLVGTGLAAVIVMANLGLEAGALSTVMVAALIGMGKISALVFPTIGLNLARAARRRQTRMLSDLADADSDDSGLTDLDFDASGPAEPFEPIAESDYVAELATANAG